MSEILNNRTVQPEVVAASDGSLTVTVPIRIKRRGLRKAVTLPDGGSLDSRPWDSSPTPLQLALARGHRWLAMLESGEARSMKEIARWQRSNSVNRVWQSNHGVDLIAVVCSG